VRLLILLLLLGQIEKSLSYFYSRYIYTMTNTNLLSTNKSYICANCNQIINDRYMLQGINSVFHMIHFFYRYFLALDKMWHEDCLKCACCDCRLGETGSTLYLKANLILCKRDYLRLFGMTGHCASCQRLSKETISFFSCSKFLFCLSSSI
jgi:hypothetical protein